jgi:serine/threonine protein kinase
MFSESYHASLPWCAPEQLLGNPCTPATDIFAMGVIMWELCTHLIRRCMVFEPANRPCASEVHDIIMASNNAGAGML